MVSWKALMTTIYDVNIQVRNQFIGYRLCFLVYICPVSLSYRQKYTITTQDIDNRGSCLMWAYISYTSTTRQPYLEFLHTKDTSSHWTNKQAFEMGFSKSLAIWNIALSWEYKHWQCMEILSNRTSNAETWPVIINHICGGSISCSDGSMYRFGNPWIWKLL